jgi:flagellar biosynthesis protein FlhA
LGILVVVGMLIMPLPEIILDIGLVIAIATSVIVILNAVTVSEPLQFSVFPSLLLVATLFRLALSIAATKLILGQGHAGHVIQTFGEFILGGNFIVGFVSFLILMIVQFIVITQGATRVSEVVARFTLDAMPGKQMAIDSDLASGLIDEDEAKARRKAVKQEADFYGAMDGASKFVKGDAIAAVLIIVVNIIAGFAVGFSRGEGDPMHILSTYAMLSVGEGLVSAIPALLISTASGLLVTRNGQEAGMGGTMFGQILAQHRVLMTAGIALCVFGFIPGFPTIIFLAIGGGLIAISRMVQKNPSMIPSQQAPKKEKVSNALTPEVIPPSGPEAAMALVAVDALEVEIGYGLTKLADSRVGGDLAERVSATRRQLAVDLGFVMPSVRIRDNATLQPNEYVIKVRGEELARATADADKLLALDSGAVIQPIAGVRTKEPVFSLEAVWIDPKLREMAERSGYTCIEPSAMIGTHLGEVVKQHAAELLTRQDVSRLLENVKENNEAIVNELVPNVVQIGDIQKVLQHLLREQVPVRDMVTILETMADFAGRVKDTEQLGELVRAAIARTITRQHLDENNTLYCMALDASVIQQMQASMQQTAGGVLLALEPSLQTAIMDDLREGFDHCMAEGRNPVVVCPTGIRLPLRRMIEGTMPALPVLAYNEVTAQANVEFIGTVGMPVAA